MITLITGDATEGFFWDCILITVLYVFYRLSMYAQETKLDQGFEMKVGDLVVQIGWEADGIGIILATGHDYATVLWPGGKLNMLFNQLGVISESR